MSSTILLLDQVIAIIIGEKVYPALNIIGGSKYIKKRSSLKTKRCELLPLLISKITTPVHTPCKQPSIRSMKLTQNNQATGSNKALLTITSAVIDSFTHLCSSSRWPITIQAQSRATKRFMETTDA